MPPSVRTLTAGVPAYNAGEKLRDSVRSLLAQDLPIGTQWSRVWIVASGCTDNTEKVASELAREDPRVVVIHQAQREGKASALREIFRHAEGDAVALLNADAIAEPGSIRELVRAAGTARGSWVVMGRPCVRPGPARGFGQAMEDLWEWHHRVHQTTLASREGNHVSDELWLVSLPPIAPLPTGVVNDGAFVGAWLTNHGGRLLYAPDARVLIDVPRTSRDHVRQRRRIHWGDRQVKALLGTTPTSWRSYARHHPAEATRALLSAAWHRPERIPWTVLLVLLEFESMLLSAWDWHVAGKDHVRWEVSTTSPRPIGPSGTDPRPAESGRTPVPETA